MEVRDALRSGKTTVIISTGGIEQNGPYNVTGKHNYVLRATTEAIARKLGNALVAPIIPFVPEGQISPPTEHMVYPGTISLAEATYRQLVREICACYRTHGFQNLILIGDSGGNQAGLKQVAADLTAEWGTAGTRVYYIPEYSNWPQTAEWLEQRHGIKQTKEGYHDDFQTEAILSVVDPKLTRVRQRVAAGRASINGVRLEPIEATQQLGRQVIEFRADAAVRAIQKVISASAASPN